MELLTLVVLIVIAVELGILAWMIRWALGKISNPVLDYALPDSLPWPLVSRHISSVG
jgi:ABC-type proline/glycine betaine transport system permease subunit